MKQLIKWSVLMALILTSTYLTTGGITLDEGITMRDPNLENTTVALVNARPIGTEQTKVTVHCSGIWVSRREILTAGHYVEPPEDLTALVFGYINIDATAVGTQHRFITVDAIHETNNHDSIIIPNESIRTATVMAWDRERDLALLRVDGRVPPHPISRVEPGRISIAEPIWAMGQTSGYWWTFNRGYVSGERYYSGPFDFRLHVLQVSIPLWVGNSGCAVYNEHGRIIGVYSFLDAEPPSIGFVIHRDEVRDFLSRAGIE